MSSINSVGSSSANSAAAAYQEMLARQLAQKNALKKNADSQSAPTQAKAPATGDVDHDGDQH